MHIKNKKSVEDKKEHWLSKGLATCTDGSYMTFTLLTMLFGANLMDDHIWFYISRTEPVAKILGIISVFLVLVVLFNVGHKIIRGNCFSWIPNLLLIFSFIVSLVIGVLFESLGGKQLGCLVYTILILIPISCASYNTNSESLSIKEQKKLPCTKNGKLIKRKEEYHPKFKKGAEFIFLVVGIVIIMLLSEWIESAIIYA